MNPASRRITIWSGSGLLIMWLVNMYFLPTFFPGSVDIFQAGVTLFIMMPLWLLSFLRYVLRLSWWEIFNE